MIRNALHLTRAFAENITTHVLLEEKQFVSYNNNTLKLHNEELCSLCCSPNIIRMIKSRQMRGAGHAAYSLEEMRIC
jgi:hypothetical protein